MPTRPTRTRRLSEAEMIKKVLAADGTPVAEKCRLLEALRSSSPERSSQYDQALLERMEELLKSLIQSREHLQKLKSENDKLTDPPWFPAIYRYVLPDEPKAMVWFGNTLRVVNLGEEIDPEQFQLGDEVFLNAELNLLLGGSPYGRPHVGETARFERYVPGGRLVLRSRDQEVVVEQTGALATTELESGDQIRWDRTTWIAYERVERRSGEEYFVAEVPDASPGQVGGQRKVLRQLLDALTRTLRSPETAERYHLNSRQSILMVGPPGCGKTLMARVAAAEISRLSGKRGKPCRIAVVKPAEWEDPYVGVTQQNIRNCFAALRKAAEDAYVLLYLDEVDAVARIRGGSLNLHNDKFLAAFLAELDGFMARGGVAVIAATNRKGLLDPAILERLNDREFHVGRPDLDAAREIFGIHLPATLPFSPNGDEAPATRDALIEKAVSLLYDPNADNELCRVGFRDGKTRVVSSRELVSGRLIEQICHAARQSACERDERSGVAGLRSEDIEQAVTEAIDKLSSTLNPGNIRTYLTDLPQDMDIVSVEAIKRPARRAYRYLRHA